MKKSIKTGFSFGLTSGIITTLGLIVGLNAGTHSKLVVVGGILTIAVADSFSDALGVHVSQEAQGGNSQKEVWESTWSTLLFKFIFALTFLIPILLFNLSTAIVVSVIWGLSVLTIFNFKLAKDRRLDTKKIVMEHLTIAILVIIITHFVGKWISLVFV